MYFFKSNKWLCFLLSLLALSFLNNASAAIYRWIDDNGNTVYSEIRPAPGIKYDRIKATSNSSVDPDQALKELKERAEAFAQRREDRLILTNEGEEALKKKKENDKICDQLRKNLQVLETHTKIRATAEGKESVALTEEERQKRIKTSKERIQKECTSK